MLLIATAVPVYNTYTKAAKLIPFDDIAPPVTNCTLNGTMNGSVYISEVTVTLTATDNESGVNRTNYTLDSGYWTDYSAPFMIATYGNHTLTVYSDGKAGNKEEDKT